MPQHLAASVAIMAEFEEIGRRASLAGAVTVSEPLLAMRLRGAAAVHERRRLALVQVVQQLGGRVPDPDVPQRYLLKHDANTVSAARSDAGVLRELAAMRLEILLAHVDLLQVGQFRGDVLNDLPELPPLTSGG